MTKTEIATALYIDLCKGHTQKGVPDKVFTDAAADALKRADIFLVAAAATEAEAKEKKTEDVPMKKFGNK